MEPFLLDLSLLEIMGYSLARNMCLVGDSLLLIYCEDFCLLDSAAHHTLLLMHKPCISDKSMTYKYATVVMAWAIILEHCFLQLFSFF